MLKEKLKIELNEYCYNCADGCYTHYGTITKVNGQELEDWMESKIAQAEQSVVAVVKAYMYDDVEDKMRGMDKLDHNDLIIGN